MKRSFAPLLLLSMFSILTAWGQPAQTTGDRPQRPGGERPRRMERENREGTPPVDRYLHYLKKTNPEEYQRLKTLKEEDPMAFRRELRQKLMARRKEMAQKHHSRGQFKTEMKAIRQAGTPEEREQAIADLRERVAAQVEENLKRREERMRQVRTQLQQLEDRHKLEREQKDQLIDRHVEKLLEKLEQETPATKD